MKTLNKLKWFSLGIVITLLITFLATPAIAAQISANATLVFNNIKITLDDVFVTPRDGAGAEVEPFIIDGTTYLPVRGIASALGLDVTWEQSTSTVKLSTPNKVNGKEVYNDEYVTVKFLECRYNDSFLASYQAVFTVVNKTDYELTFQSDSLAFNGTSYNNLMGSDSVAPKSTGQITFALYDGTLPTTGITKISGQIRVIDFSYTIIKTSYEARFVDVTA